MSCYFDRDTVSLPGFAEYFRRSSLEEREHAQVGGGVGGGVWGGGCLHAWSQWRFVAL